LRMELPAGHALVAAGPLAEFSARVETSLAGEKMRLGLRAERGSAAQIAEVEFYGCYQGYEENGLGDGRRWHGFTKKRKPLGHLGTANQPPFAVEWDLAMLPAQSGVAVRAIVRFKSAPRLIYRTEVKEGLEIPERAGVRVAVLNVDTLPERFWSRAGREKSATITLPFDVSRIERAELHTVAWTGGAGAVKEYFTLNGRHFPVAEGHDHRTHYTVLPVEPVLLRRGPNAIRILSDTKEHGIELLKPGPSLVVRYRP
jgi:hypothetical protein